MVQGSQRAENFRCDGMSKEDWTGCLHWMSKRESVAMDSARCAFKYYDQWRAIVSMSLNQSSKVRPLGVGHFLRTSIGSLEEHRPINEEALFVSLVERPGPQLCWRLKMPIKKTVD